MIPAALMTTACVNSYYMGGNGSESGEKVPQKDISLTSMDMEYFNNMGFGNFILSELMKKEPVKVKGLYLTNATIANPKQVEHFIDLANKTEINTYVIDIKDNSGIVAFAMPDMALVKEIRSVRNIYDPVKMVQKLHDNHIYVIGRIVCFDDSVLAKAKPDLAIHNSDGSLYTDGLGSHWVNPYNKHNWKYMVDIAKSAKKYGFDEIQFDYVRFPSDKTAHVVLDKCGFTCKKAEVIKEFLEYAKSELGSTPVSADVFGIICESPGDTEGLGQDIEMVGRNIDYLSPMIYPSHYALGQGINGKVFPKPDLEPYGVVYHSLIKAKIRVAAVPDYKAKMRPYLQDFNATWLGKGNWQKYNEDQVRDQIKAVYDAGYDEWILWNAANTYSEKAFN